MDQMHDELVKLREVSPKFTASKSSVVTSANDDDEWETVGPMNKSAVRRTQIFVPSDLRDIFGGQLRSIVKSKGSKDLLLYSHISYFTLIIKEKIWLYWVKYHKLWSVTKLSQSKDTGLGEKSLLDNKGTFSIS